MNGVDAAILRTLLYGDTFHFAMTPAEIHRYLIHYEPVCLDVIEDVLATSDHLRPLICQSDGYIALVERRDLIELRLQREAMTRTLWTPALRYGRWLAAIPFVRMVALTGALSVRNPMSLRDDFDYMLVTQPGRVWLARGFAVLLVRLARLWGAEICPNYVVASDRLEQQRRDLYIAHEIAQMVPLYGYDIYAQVYQNNPWVRDHLPNTCMAQTDLTPCQGRGKRLFEWLLRGPLGDWVERWERRRKTRKFTRHLGMTDTAAEIDDHSVKGHFDDHGLPVLAAYHARLQHYGLSYEAAVGD